MADAGRPAAEDQVAAAPKQNLSAPAQIAKNHSINDAFMDNIRAKLDMLDQI